MRLSTTAYGDIPALEEGLPEPIAPTLSQEPDGQAARLVARRGAFSRQLVFDAQKLFEERLGRPVSENEARNLLGNLADYLGMLVVWSTKPETEIPAELADKPRRKYQKRPKVNGPRRPRGRPRKTPTLD